MKLATILLVCAAVPAAAQTMTTMQAARPEEAGRYARAADSVPRTIADAEARARRLPAAARSDSIPLQQMFREPETGSSERRCTDIGSAEVARSGEFVAGPFTAYAASWRLGYGKLYWAPVNGSRASPATMVLTATQLDGPEVPRVFSAELTRGAVWFYIGGYHVPSVGKWMFVVTAGDMWGCFVYTLR